MNPPHICQVVSGINEGGGIERHVQDLVSELTKTHRVSVLADQSMRSLFAEDVKFLSIDYQRSRFNPFLSLHLWKSLKALAPDCIHVHGRKAAGLVGRLNRFLGVPSVITIHNLSPSTKSCRYFDAVIGVSATIRSNVTHPVKFTIYNGR